MSLKNKKKIIVDSMVRIPLSYLTDYRLEEMRADLTLEAAFNETYSFGAPKVLNCYEEDDEYISVPRNWPKARKLLRLNPGMVDDRRSWGGTAHFDWKGTWRPGQEEWVDASVRGLEKNGMGVMSCAPCGWGKTAATLGIVSRVARTTLVIVHKEFLMTQWAKRIKEFLGITPGFVQGDLCDFRNKKIVIGMVNSLSMKDYPEDLYRWPGLVVVDEAHRVSCPMFMGAIGRFPSMFRQAISATPRRADGMEDAFFWHMGNIAAVAKGDELPCISWIVKHDIELSAGDYMVYGKPNLSKVISLLCEDSARTSLIVGIISKAARSGRKVLVLTDRVEHIHVMVDACRTKLLGTEKTVSAYLSGSTKVRKQMREEAVKADVIIATWPMAKEGLDIPDLDCLVMATPKADVEQAVGRIRRKLDGKKTPHVVDICDNLNFLWGLHKKRYRWYREQGWPIKEVQ